METALNPQHGASLKKQQKKSQKDLRRVARGMQE
jgi:hypothetical protein